MVLDLRPKHLHLGVPGTAGELCLKGAVQAKLTRAEAIVAGTTSPFVPLRRRRLREAPQGVTQRPGGSVYRVLVYI